MTISFKLDTREVNPQMNLISAKYPIKITNLAVGDIQIIKEGVSDIVYIEIKKGNDLLASKDDKRLEAQLNDLSGYEFSLLAMIGDYYNIGMANQHNMHYYKNFPETLIKIDTNLALRKHNGRYRVATVHYRDEQEFQIALLNIADQLEKGKLRMEFDSGENVRIMKKQKMSSQRARKLSILMSLGNIGKKTAVLLLDAFNNNIQNCLNATDDEWTAIKGIGDKTVQELRDLGFKPFMEQEEDIENLYIPDYLGSYSFTAGEINEKKQ